MEETPRTIINDDPYSWDIAWRKNITPWDKDRPQPALRELVESRAINLPRGKDKKALVPGCGSGNDVAYLAATLGITTIGVDISPKAVKVADERLAVTAMTEEARRLVSFQAADFFSLDGQYDLVYDYTFFVAIPPKRRAEWGQRMAALVKRGGQLVVLAYPLAEADKGWGPPWFLRPEHYDEVLKAEDWEKELNDVPLASEGDHIARERMMVWRRS
ncbi:S-adenosyl-L-methionine-dependent methyltransferase [Schizophyllum fasciatum]